MYLSARIASRKTQPPAGGKTWLRATAVNATEIVDFAAAKRQRSRMGKSGEMTNAEAATLLAAIAQRQDRQAFAALFEFLAPRLKHQCMRFGCAGDVAEDLVQDTFVTVWRKAAQFDPDRGDAFAWIYRINVNLRVDRARRMRLSAKAVALDPMSAADAGIAPSDADVLRDGLPVTSIEHEQLDGALTELPPDQRVIVELSYFSDLPHAEIARRLALPLGTVKSRIRLALRKLRTAMEAGS